MDFSGDAELPLFPPASDGQLPLYFPACLAREQQQGRLMAARGSLIKGISCLSDQLRGRGPSLPRDWQQ